MNTTAVSSDPQPLSLHALVEKPSGVVPDQQQPQTVPDRPAPFQVPNRSKAQKPAKMILGPTARLWVYGDMIKVGTEYGSSKEIAGAGVSFDAAMEGLVYRYLKEPTTYVEAKKRFWSVGANALVECWRQELLTHKFQVEVDAELKAKEEDKKAALQRFLSKLNVDRTNGRHEH